MLRSVEHPATVLDSETTWERDVAAELRAAVGAEPAANVCVYCEADIQELGTRLDPLATVLSLIRTHPHVAVQEGGGAVTTGPAAIELILAAARPTGVAPKPRNPSRGRRRWDWRASRRPPSQRGKRTTHRPTVKKR